MSESQSYIETALPIPQYDEIYPLYTFTQIGVPSDNKGHDYLAERVKVLNPTLSEIIRHDISYFLQYEVPDAYSTEDCLDYTEGIEIGYNFAIGVFTYLFFFKIWHKKY
jgi:hypothetical protein